MIVLSLSHLHAYVSDLSNGGSINAKILNEEK